MATKRQAVEQLINSLEAWVHSKNIIDSKTIQKIKQDQQITTNKVVAGIERWVLPPYKAGLLDDYLKAEIEKAKMFSGKLLSVYNNDPTMQAKMVHVRNRVKTITDEDRAHLLKQFSRICQILLL
jgi:hypothetical protein